MMAYRDVIVISSDSPSPPPPSSPPPPLPAQPSLFDHLEDDLPVALNGDLSDNNNLRLVREESSPMPAILRSSSGAGSQHEGMSKCEEDVLSCFPDICPDYLRVQAAEHQWDSQGLITRLLDDLEKDQPYPKRPKSLKRKRSEKIQKDDDEEEMRKKFDDDPRLASKGRVYFELYTKKAKALLKAAFPQRYADDIETTFKANNSQLYATYLVLDKASWSPEAVFMRVKPSTRRPKANAEQSLRYGAVHQAEIDAIAAFDAVRAVCAAKAQARESKEAQEKQKAQEEEENLQRAKAEGSVAECGCCYDELALNCMVHCAGETTHWFCRSCARRMAEHAVGLSKCRLGCMSVDGCDATFSRDQKELFLDDKLTNALELIEQEEVLRLAGIENLENCPFCPYAAEYPPVEENKEFRCENPDCRLVSCRLCREETHIPKTCQESAKERGHSARRAIEEAMSAALIRKCNKCGTPFIKEHGCNKMTCTRGGCLNVQCYVCSESCDYNHFDDTSRGGKKGNCPLFDSVEDRHRNEVREAEALARKQVAEKNPEVMDEFLNINFSDKVKADDARRMAANPPPPAPQRFPDRLGVPVPPIPPVDPANWVPVPHPYDYERMVQNEGYMVGAQYQGALYMEQMRAAMEPQVQAQAQAQAEQAHHIPRGQQAQAQQGPVAQPDYPGLFEYAAPYMFRDAPPPPPAPVPASPWAVHAARVAQAARAAFAAPAIPAAPAARAAPAPPPPRAAPAAPADPAAPAEPDVGDHLKHFGSNRLAPWSRNARAEQAVPPLGGPAGRINPFPGPHENSPFQRFAIQFGAHWAPGVAARARNQAAQLGHQPN